MKSLSRNTIVLLVAAFMLAMSAGAGATAALVVTGKHIKNGTVTGKDIKNRSLAAKDLSRAAKLKLRGLRGATGPAGPVGATGATGATGASGAAGLPGLSDFTVVTRTVTIPTMGTGSVTATCDSGQKAISGTSSYAALTDTLFSQADRLGDSSFAATGVNTGVGGQQMTLEVICATVAD